VRSRALLLGLLAALALALWLLRGGGPGPGEEPGREREGARDAPPLVALAGAPVREGAAAEGFSAMDGSGAAAPAPAPAWASVPAVGRVLLRGVLRVEGLPAGAMLDPPAEIGIPPKDWSLRDFTSNEERQHLVAEAHRLSRAGPFGIDLTDVLAPVAQRRRQDHLTLETADPRYAAAPAWIPIPDPGLVLAGAVALDEVEVVLRPATLLLGTVEKPEGGPAPLPRILRLRLEAGRPAAFDVVLVRAP
jgi:hypothetical protein